MTDKELTTEVKKQVDTNYARIEHTLIKKLTQKETDDIEKRNLLFGNIKEELGKNLILPIETTLEQETEFGIIASSYITSIVSKLKAELDKGKTV